MKIAILGNMNNNGFSLMRYFRDLGYDAYLLLYSNDGILYHKHHHPKMDSWEYQKWKPYIRRTKIYNNYFTGITNPFFMLIVKLFLLLFKNKYPKNFTFNKELTKKNLLNYDIYITSGIGPALFYKLKKKLHIFFNYSNGIEYIGAYDFLNTINRSSFVKNLILSHVKKNQIKGLGLTKNLVISGSSNSKKNLTKLNLKYNKLLVPLVYNEKIINPKNKLSKNLKYSLAKIKSKKIFFSHTRHPGKINPTGIKNNEITIRAFHKIIKKIKSSIFLVLFELGEGVAESKKIIEKLGIKHRVIWLPKMGRKEILFLLNNSKILAGIDNVYKKNDLHKKDLIGGVGWEFLSAGIPTISSVNLKPYEFEDLTGAPIYPVIKANNQNELFLKMKKILKNKKFRESISSKSKKWFEEHHSINLAKKWIEVCNLSYDKK